jgi:hypothetical protein
MKSINLQGSSLVFLVYRVRCEVHYSEQGAWLSGNQK